VPSPLPAEVVGGTSLGDEVVLAEEALHGV
jgi:hypothetical protein